MKKVIPAVWFQSKLTPRPSQVTRPAVLELLERELGQVAGGIIVSDSTTYIKGGIPNDTSD